MARFDSEGWVNREDVELETTTFFHSGSALIVFSRNGHARGMIYLNTEERKKLIAELGGAVVE